MFIHHFPILSILIWTPIIGSLLLLLIKENNLHLIKIVGFSFSSITLIFSIIILYNFNPHDFSLQFVEKIPWITNLNINYHLAVDGFSVIFIILTTIITSIIMLFNFSEERSQNNKFISLFLLLEGLLLGVFCSFDSILFYIFL